MILIGLSDMQKNTVIKKYLRDNNIKKVYVISPFEINLDLEFDFVWYKDAIEYHVFYRLLQEIDSSSLIVLNECLRTQNRYDLTYNCIRNFLKQTGHQIVFNLLPQIDKPQDFMIMFDFDTNSRFKREGFNISLIRQNCAIELELPDLVFRKIQVWTSEETKTVYEIEKRKLFDGIGNSDPDTIPRQLHLLAGKEKTFMNSNLLIARNKRLRGDNIVTYSDYNLNANGNKGINILDLPHRFIDFSDFMRKSFLFEFDVLVSDLRVDRWYFGQYNEWGKSINETIASIS